MFVPLAKPSFESNEWFVRLRNEHDERRSRFRELNSARDPIAPTWVLRVFSKRHNEHTWLVLQRA
jgi:hypothetical protein